MFTSEIILTKKAAIYAPAGFLKEIDTNIHISANYLLGINKYIKTAGTDSQTFASDNQTLVADSQTFVADNQTFTADDQTFASDSQTSSTDYQTFVADKQTFVAVKQFLGLFNKLCQTGKLIDIPSLFKNNNKLCHNLLPA